MLDEYIGQDRVRENLQVSIAAARQRGEALDHVLLYGPPGLGKTTLAYVIANEMGAPVRATSGPVLEKPGDLAGILTNLGEREVLFIDEIHRMSPTIEEILYPALEDYELDIMIGQGPSARSVKVPLQKFTLIGATTRAGLLTSPLRSRFGIVHRLEFYTPADLEEIVRRSAKILDVPIDDAAAAEIARRSRGTPRIANRLLRRVRDYAQVRADGTITLDVAHAALKLLEVDEHGFDEVDRKLLRTIIDKFGGGPVGLNTIAAAISEEKDAIEDIYEPFLIQIGFLDRTPRGRVATPRAYGYFGLDAPRSKKGFTTVVSDRRTQAALRRAADDHHVAGDLRAAARAHQRRPREDGRHQRRVDSPADRRPRAPHRRSGRRRVGSRHRSRDQSHRERRPHARRHRRHHRRDGDARHDVSEHRVPDSAQDRRASRVGLRPERRLLGVHLRALDREPVCRDRRARARARGRHRRDVEHHRLQGSRHLRDLRRRRRRRRRLGGHGRGDGRIIDFEHEIDGGGGPALCMPAGGSLRPPSHETVDQRLHYVKQDGQTVFKFAIRKTEEIARRLLDRNGLKPSDLSLFVSHQANRRIIESAAEKLGLAPDQVIINIERFGNTTAATIPLALNDAVCAKRLKKGDLVLLASVGAGFTVGSVLLRWGF